MIERTAGSRDTDGQWRLAQIATLIIFILSRALYFAAGIRFAAEPVSKFWQMIDPQLMRYDLWRSLWYLHMQPPGYNLFIGLVVKFFPTSYANVLWAIHLAIGLGIALTLLDLMRLFAVPAWLAAVLTILFIAAPGTVLFETEAVYEYPILLLVQLSAVTLIRLCRTGSLRWSLAFFGCLLGLEMVRHTFHLLYLFIVCLALLWFLPRYRRAVVIGSLVAVLPALALYTKNAVLFGRFTPSTWAGMNSGVVTTFQLTPEEADNLIQRGVVTPLARIAPFTELSAYYSFIKMPARTGIPILDQETTSTGHANYNNLAYLQLYDLYVKNSAAILLHYPRAFGRSLAIAWFTYLLPTSDLHYFDLRVPPIRGWDRFYSAAVFGQFMRAASRKDLRALNASGRTFLLPLYMGLYLVILIPAIVIWTTFQLLYRRDLWTQPQLLTLAFMLFTVVFISLVSTTLSNFECNRYRFPLDGFFIVLTALMLTRFNRQGVKT